MILEYYDRIIRKFRMLIIQNELYKKDKKFHNIIKNIQYIEANRELLSNSELKSISLTNTENEFIKNKLTLLEDNLDNLNHGVESFDANKLDEYLDEFLKLLQKYNLFFYTPEKEIEGMPFIEYDFSSIGTREDGTRFIPNVARKPEKVEKHIEKEYTKYNDEYKKEFINDNSISSISYKSIVDKHKPALNIINIAEVFSQYIVNYSSEHTSTIIGIFGQWGRGKTFLYDEIEKSIKEENKKIYFCKFQPWKYQEKESAWAYLYEQLLNNYLDHKPTFLKKIIIKHDIENKIISTIFSKLDTVFKLIMLNINRLGISCLILSILSILLIAAYIFTPLTLKFDLLGFLGFSGSIFLFKTYNLFIKSKDIVSELVGKYGRKIDYSKYLGFQNEIEKEIKYLINTYITDKDEKLILFVDDLDRCNEDMIIDIMDSLRLVLEDKDINSKIIMITAVDERILLKAVEHKYFNNKIKENNRFITPTEYIEKFFLIGIKLNHLNHFDVSELVDDYAKKLNSLSSINFHDEKYSFRNKKDDYDRQEKNNNSAVTKVRDGKMPTGEEQTEEKTVLNSNEIEYIKEVLLILNPNTPRKVNRTIQRYLLFKSFMLNEFHKDEYEGFGHKILIELVLFSKKNPEITSFIKNEQCGLDKEITLCDMNNGKHTIKKKELMLLVQYAEMVTPF